MRTLGDPAVWPLHPFFSTGIPFLPFPRRRKLFNTYYAITRASEFSLQLTHRPDERVREEAEHRGDAIQEGLD
jgi:hypothetical protein